MCTGDPCLIGGGLFVCLPGEWVDIICSCNLLTIARRALQKVFALNSSGPAKKVEMFWLILFSVIEGILILIYLPSTPNWKWW